MANDVVFEGKERRMPKIEKCLADNGIESLEAARDLCLSKGIDVESIVKGVQPIAFDNAVWAYTLGVALAIKSGVKTASEASAVIGQGLRRSVYRARLQSRETSASVTETSAQDFFMKIQNALHSSQVTSHSRQPRVLSV